MAVEVRMPKLGMTMENGLLSRWLKQVGERVALGEPLAEVSTEKINHEIGSPGEGVLQAILVPEGSEAHIGALLGLIGETAGLPAAADQPAEGDLRASPVARRLAREHGIDLAQVRPATGDRITRDDVLAYLAQCEPAPQAPAAGQPPAVPPAAPSGLPIPLTQPRPAPAPLPGSPQAIPLIGMRKAIAEHLVRSLQASAQLTVANEVDFGELVRVRELLLPGFQAATGIRLTYTDLLIALAARALGAHPQLNSTLEGDSILLHRDVNMGVAVAVPRGLVVPVIPHAQALSLAAIAGARADLARRAAEDRLTAADLAGGTFTITNPGLPGADLSTPILNSPQNAILGVGRIVQKPAVHDGQICVRLLCWLSVTFDHRAMDGVPVAAFLETLGKLIADPLPALPTGQPA